LSILQKIKYLQSFPFPVMVKKVKNVLVRKITDKKHQKVALETDHRAIDNYSIPYQYLKAKNLKEIGIPPKLQQYLTKKFLHHRFDLLGSGWVKNNYTTQACGLENYQYQHNLPIENYDKKGDWLNQVMLDSHLTTAKAYWQIISTTLPDYEPIDWQKDFKSGFRWSAKHWYKAQRTLMNGHIGVDLKVPWELGRLQHLPQLAFFGLAKEADKNRLIQEFKCQVLDFFMTNPIGMGVNFNCPMDVGIRAANILVAYDLFRDLDATNILDDQFETILAANIYQHGRHILEDIEYREGLTSNHYLANIAGLLYIAAYLNRTEETDKWLAFSVQELVRAMDRQFFEDGGNFEGSTVYHRLSGEMMVYGAALIQALDADKKRALSAYKTSPWLYEAPLFKLDKQVYDVDNPSVLPQRFFDKLGRAAYFTQVITKPTGEAPQFGDNDSGRFFKFTPTGQFLAGKTAIKKYKNLSNRYAELYTDDQYWDENYLDLSAFLTSCGAFFGIEHWQKHPLERQIIQQLIGPNAFGFSPKEPIKLGKLASWTPSDFPYNKETILSAENKISSTPLTKGLTLETFDIFQIYVFRSERLYLCIGGIGNDKQHHSWGHMHNDKLSFELMIDGKDVVVNPGTYLYTPIPKRRLEFRNTAAHNTLVVEGVEQNECPSGNLGLFNMKHQTKVELLEVTHLGITLRLTYRSIQQLRKIEILEQAIKISDYSSVPFTPYFNRFDLYSNGYGKWVRS